MDRRAFLRNVSFGALGCSLASTGYRAVARGAAASSAKKPNFVIIFIDDMGYGEIEPFGSTVTSTIDLLPTFAELAGARTPPDRIIDGKDISALLFAETGARSPHDVFFYKGMGVRLEKWKFLDKGKGELYDLDEDLGEKNNIASRHPDIVKRLRNLLEQHVDDLEKDKRPAAFVKAPKPILPHSRT